MQISQTLKSLKPTQIVAWFVVILSMVLLWLSNNYLTERFTENQRSISLQRADLYANSISTALQRNAYVPLLLSRDQALIAALQSGDYTNTSQRLINFKNDLDAASIFLMDIDGRIVATSDRRDIGSLQEKPDYFVKALRATETVFSASIDDTSTRGFYYARKITAGTSTIGVIVVEVNLQRQELIWRNSDAIVVLIDAKDQILLASNTNWRQKTLTELLSSPYSPTPLQRILSGVKGEQTQGYAYIDGRKLLVSDIKIGFLGWHIGYFSSLENVQARVNALIALELMVLSLFAALVFFILSRRTAKQSAKIQRESEQLRRLNARLSAAIEQRQMAEKNLETAEQSLEQASKLAALGQLSASVSHELNQPLAAMRTYLAGARLLMQRNRSDEALDSFRRIDDLIERMGAITRQLKSHARKGDYVQVVVDMRKCAEVAISMMEPQLSYTHVSIVRNFADEPALVLGDPVRIEQIIVNLLRNALDAVKQVDDKRIEINVEIKEEVILRVQDNGTGILDAEGLFEPFSTTKKPGEGVGLGLAISAGFAAEMKGKLTGRNATPVGAIFELTLPIANEE